MKYVLYFLLIVFVSCKDKTQQDTKPLDTQSDLQREEKNPARPSSETDSQNKFTADTFMLADGTIGYDIYKNGVRLIHQDRIPGLPGKRGFENITQATNVSQMVIEKLQKASTFPTISIDELKHCGVNIPN